MEKLVCFSVFGGNLLSSFLFSAAYIQIDARTHGHTFCKTTFELSGFDPKQILVLHSRNCFFIIILDLYYSIAHVRKIKQLFHVYK